MVRRRVSGRGGLVLGLGALFLAVSAAGCGSGGSGSDSDGGNPATGGTGNVAPGTGGSSGRGIGIPLGGGSGGGGGLGPGGKMFEECAGDVVSGKLAPLDMFVMLDTSGSMLDPTENGTQKWEAVKEAIIAFLRDPGSVGLGVGIQYFPQRKPNVPAECTSDADCGPDGGACFLKACFTEVGLVPCASNADCRSLPVDASDCVAFGQCELEPDWACAPLGSTCLSDTGADLGVCRSGPSVCLGETACTAATYATPAVPIAQLPDAADALVASISERTPSGNTPTGPALRGALQHSLEWAGSHPGHTVVTVLATDGLPTECTPLEIPTIALLAQAGTQATPAIRTFVIGVFGPRDSDAAQENLDTIARAGGTEQAFLVDTSQDVTAQFLEALSAIRGSQLGCEFQIPEPGGGEQLDYRRVNVLLTNGGDTTPLYFVGYSEADCDANGGWYYDSDPADAAPTRIIMCPSTCGSIAGSTEASVQIQLGCEIRVR
ncbi:MAG: VWA domain-containing protein [Pseudomonadota bacterium]